MSGTAVGQQNLDNNPIRRYCSYAHLGQLPGLCVIDTVTQDTAHRSAHRWLMLCCLILKFLVLLKQGPSMFTLHISSSLQSI